MEEEIRKIFGNKIRVRACGICVKNDAILLIRHVGLGTKGMLWSPPGGGVKYNESIEDALKREMLEETGFKVQVGKFLFVNEYIRNSLHAIELFFKVDIIKGKLIQGLDPELSRDKQIIKETKFVTFKEMMIMDIETLHNVLHGISDAQSLLKMTGYFKF